jgi:hypothetical protein
MIGMFRKKTILSYETGTELFPDILTPAKKHIPTWYKEISKWKNNEIYSFENGINNHTIKQCMPFLDSLSSGYMIVLPSDLYVKNINGNPTISWRVCEWPPKLRGEPADLKLVPFGHHPTEFTWQTAVAMTVPIGYSMFITHPINRHDLPFTTLSGIVDGGLIMNPGGNIPFYIQNGFEGIIPQGTPIAQVIPFLQKNWTSKKTKGLVKISLEHNNKGLSLLQGWYKKTFWTRKKYD